MTPDTAKRYLLHNVYGDADDLVACAPADVVCVPFGPTEDAEKVRNDLLDGMGCGCSCLPALFTWVSEEGKGDDFVPAHWRETRIGDEPRPWAWENIE